MSPSSVLTTVSRKSSTSTGGTGSEVRKLIRFGRPDVTLFPKPGSPGCQAPEAVPKWPERVIDCFDSHVAFIAQGHVEVPPDEDWPEIRSGLSEHIQDFPAGFRNVVESDRIVRNAQRKAGGGHESLDLEVIEIRDGMLAETPTARKESMTEAKDCARGRLGSSVGSLQPSWT